MPTLAGTWACSPPDMPVVPNRMKAGNPRSEQPVFCDHDGAKIRNGSRSRKLKEDLNRSDEMSR
jgi:hypothetical protein